MPPYDARGEENGRKRHRAVLIGVEHYTGTRNDLPAVATNLRLMREALTAERTGVLGPDDLVVIPADGDLVGGGPPGGGSTGGHTPGGSIDGSDMDSSGTAGGDTSGGTQGADMGSGPKGGTPKGPAPAPAVDPLRVRAALAAARRDVTGLLVVYFAGHGIVRPDGSDLNLMFTDSRVTRDRHHPFVDTLSWRDDVMPELRNSRADWVVVILDCCFMRQRAPRLQPGRGAELRPAHRRRAGRGDPAGGSPYRYGVHGGPPPAADHRRGGAGHLHPDRRRDPPGDGAAQGRRRAPVDPGRAAARRRRGPRTPGGRGAPAAAQSDPGGRCAERGHDAVAALVRPGPPAPASSPPWPTV